MLTLSHQNSSVKINPQGCKIEDLTLDGTQIFWSGERPDGKHAATHPCIPNFGKITTGKFQPIPQHGPARNATWNLIHINGNSALYRWKMPAIEGLYPNGLVVDRIFRLNQHFTLTTKIHNTTKHRLSVNPGEHCYFPCDFKDAKDVTINGQKTDAAKLTDTIYRNIRKNLNINIPGIGEIRVSVSGYRQIALWSLKDAKFICIEPIAGQANNIYNQDNLLNPNEIREYKLKISR